MKKIITKYDPPPIPTRAWDWSACEEDCDEDDPVGWGSTEQEAIDDLKQELEDE